MLELLFVLALLGAFIILPLLLVGFLLQLIFNIVLLPFDILGSVIGWGVVGIVLAVLAVVLGSVLGVFSLVGLIFLGLPVLAVAAAIWLLCRLIRGGNRSSA